MIVASDWFTGHLVGLALLCALTACSILTGSDESEDMNVTVTVEDAVAEVREVEFDNGMGLSVSVPLMITIHNGSTESAQHGRGPCDIALGRHEAGGWHSVWQRLCTLVRAEPREIAPGEEYTIELLVQARLGHGQSKQWNEPVSGKYRLTLHGFYLERTALPDGAPISNPFQIEARQVESR